MGFTLALAGLGYPHDGDVLAAVGQVAEEAAHAGANLLVLPECLMAPGPMTPERVLALGETCEGPFAQGLAAICRETGLWMVATLFERTHLGKAPYNTAIILDDTGCTRARYRKCHLYDAHGTLESLLFTRGSLLPEPVETPFGTLGVGICYDLRFPELTRHLALGGADLLVFPAAWRSGPHKERHWSTLLAARAIENECYVAGVCHGGPENVGTSHVFDPWGVACAEQLSPQLYLAQVDGANVRKARDDMPVFSHRRSRLYGNA